jgi:hypothetical protein
MATANDVISSGGESAGDLPLAPGLSLAVSALVGAGDGEHIPSPRPRRL